ncbi:MAG: hypothetical protein LBQ52_02425 [Helicobacteraceae bacterium]|jgi:uncharacterized Zn finger protein (UPF0148 family)|nr:hypothetical protein [Helicobacteraceae bacterium]
MANKSSLNFLKNMQNIAVSQKNYGASETVKEMKVAAKLCPNCGAARAKYDGLTRCAYCGYKFIDTSLSDGIFIKKEDNSRDGK